jgi:hypothetical protein
MRKLVEQTMWQSPTRINGPYQRSDNRQENHIKAAQHVK